MGNVGNIEKVMVGGILVIIIIILGIAIWGNTGPDPYEVDPGMTAQAMGPGNGVPLKSEVLSVDDDSRTGSTPVNRGGTVPYNIATTGGDLEDDASAEPENVSAIPATPPAVMVPRRPAEYTVVAGDTFEGIAIKLFGSASYTDELMKANEDVDPRRMTVGLVLNVPQLDEQPASGSSTPPSTTSSPPMSAAVATNSYTVKAGDTLFAISKSVFGSSRRWRDIWSVNKSQLPEPSDLKPGMVLTLPQ